MKDNISKLIRRELLKENEYDQGREAAIKFTNDGLAMAFRAGCFREGVQQYTFKDASGTQQTVAYISNSSKIPDYPLAFMYPPEAGKNGGKLQYYKKDGVTKYEKDLNWTCNKLTALVEDSMNPELVNFVKSITEAGIANIYTYGDTKVSNTDKVNGNCKLTKFSDIPQLKDRPDVQSLLPKVVNAFVWVCGQQEGGSVTAQMQDLQKRGFKECTDADLVAGSASIEIKTVGNKKMCKPKTGGAAKIKSNPTYIKLAEMGNKIADGDITKENCRGLMETYELAADKALPIPQNDLDDMKNHLRACFRDKTISLDGLFSKKYTKLQDKLNYMADIDDGYGGKISYRLSTAASTPQAAQIRESRILKSIIRENLIQLSDSKKKVLIEEHKIIVNRFSVISEGITVKTKKQKQKLVSDLVNEALSLNSQGLHPQLINEQFWDMIKSFFGNSGSGVVQMIAERIINSIITTLTPLDPNGWVANIIVTTVGNIPPADYVNGKIFSCDYISDKLSKGIAEGALRKVQNEKGMAGPIYDIIRNSLVETLEDTEFGTKIENMLGDLICPMLGQVKSKMDSTAETLKAKALA